MILVFQLFLEHLDQPQEDGLRVVEVVVVIFPLILDMDLVDLVEADLEMVVMVLQTLEVVVEEECIIQNQEMVVQELLL